MEIVKGDLITLAVEGHFDIIGHGCNCQGMMGAGIAKQIAGKFPGASRVDRVYKKGMENLFGYNHPLHMLGNMSLYSPNSLSLPLFVIANLYTQVLPGANFDLNYGLVPALKKLNYIYKGKHVGLPMIGAGIGAGNWNQIVEVITRLLDKCTVTIVEYEPK